MSLRNEAMENAELQKYAQFLLAFANICLPVMIIKYFFWQLVRNIGYLKDRGILACGTLRSNVRNVHCKQDINKLERGTMDFKSDSDSVIIVVM